MVDLTRLRSAYTKAKEELLAERTPQGHWVGELSSSALSTATAISALAVVRRGQGSGVRGQEGDTPSALCCDEFISRGVAWIVAQQNEDGGFGDTDLSHSNIATTFLVVAALHLAGAATEHGDLIRRATAYIESKGGLAGLRARYGIDKTFVVPIMTNLALAGLVDWREIDPLPFELACVPQSLYRFVGMPVVSYAIPALVAIGQAHYFHASPRNPITRLIRRLSIRRSLKVLRRMQPESGGYLEATPLTSFVVMSLASAGKSPVADDVIRAGVKFLVNSIRPNGSWPIDTNLATWNTSLAINALAGAGEEVAALLGPQCLHWLLSCQHVKAHPFTGATPGGFGWSDLTGAVPDADDTAGALLAVRAMHAPSVPTLENLDESVHAAGIGVSWLLRLQNRDGGWPTFCRGWGKLPFDRSGTDLTAHSLRAMSAWEDWIACRDIDVMDGVGGMPRYTVARDDAMRYLRQAQHADGSWEPLWFGNQDSPDEDNPVYGTAKVLMAYRDLGLMNSPEALRGVAWLVANQNADGGWGSGVWSRFKISDRRFQIGAAASLHHESGVQSLGEAVLRSSIEETALAIEALLPAMGDPAATAAVEKGLTWLLDRVERGEHRRPAPIGFYFAKLWYYERLYPMTFTVAALGRALRTYTRLSEVENDPPQALRTP